MATTSTEDWLLDFSITSDDDKQLTDATIATVLSNTRLQTPHWSPPQIDTGADNENKVFYESNFETARVTMPAVSVAGISSYPPLAPLTDESLIQMASVELNECSATRHMHLEALRQLVLKDKQLHCRTDDAFLVQFLRHRKYNVAEAHQRIRTYFLTRRAHRDVFSDYSPLSVRDVFSSGALSVLPDTDKHGRRVVLWRFGLWNYHKTPREHLLRASTLLLERLLLDESVQVSFVNFLLIR